MVLKTILGLIKRVKLSLLIIAFFVIAIPYINHKEKIWNNNEGIITWDVKSYYAYLPATFIYNDLLLDYLNKDSDKFDKWIWPVTTPTGKKAIVTSCGMSILYSPFFFIAHAIALNHPSYEADGYSLPYHYALAFAVYFYFLLSLLVLRKILLKYFNEKVTALTLLAIGLGTNLFYYVTYSAAMPHGFNFSLIVFFIYFLGKWYDNKSLKYTIYLGLISGLIALVRPTNIIVLTLMPLWQVGNVSDLKENIKLLLKKWHLIVLMAIAFILVWVPQFAYWEFISGKLFYFSYGEKGAKFFFLNPQFWNVLFSYKKGWFVYTPLMLLATLSIPLAFKKPYKLGWAISVYWFLTVYLVASWWCWWFGGSFGQRSLIDFYGLMAIPLAIIIKKIFDQKRHIQIAGLLVIGWLIFFNSFNIRQYNNGAIHYWWMNKESYWENFMEIKPTCKYWQTIMIPNYSKARKGTYEWAYSYNRTRVVSDEMLKEEVLRSNINNKRLIDSLKQSFNSNEIPGDSVLKVYAINLVKTKNAEPYFNKLKLNYYIKAINTCGSWKDNLKKQAKRKNITLDEMIALEALRIHNTYGEKYVTK